MHEQSSRLLPDSRLVIGVLDLPLLIAVTWAFRTWAKEEQQRLSCEFSGHVAIEFCQALLGFKTGKRFCLTSDNLTVIVGK